MANLANLAKVAILAKFGQGCRQNISSEYISKARRALKMLAKMANLVKVAILAIFGQGC